MRGFCRLGLCERMRANTQINKINITHILSVTVIKNIVPTIKTQSKTASNPPFLKDNTV